MRSVPTKPKRMGRVREDGRTDDRNWAASVVVKITPIEARECFFLDLIAEVTRGCGRWLEKDSKVLPFRFGGLAEEKSGAPVVARLESARESEGKDDRFLSLVFVVLDDPLPVVVVIVVDLASIEEAPLSFSPATATAPFAPPRGTTTR